MYVVLIGLLQAQLCLGSYDSAAHMSEETKRPDVAGPIGMVSAVIGASVFGWFFIVALLMGVRDYEATVATPTGYPVTQILLDNFGRSWTLVLMSLLLVACWFCGFITVTGTSRLMYAFSRDHALVRRNPSISFHPIFDYSHLVTCGIRFILDFHVQYIVFGFHV